MPRSGIAESCGISIFSCFFFWGNSILISIVATLIYIPPMTYKCFFFFTSSPAFVVAWFLNDYHLNSGEMKSQCCFDLHFLFSKEIPLYWLFLYTFVDRLYFF
jgi:hypothetical protein